MNRYQKRSKVWDKFQIDGQNAACNSCNQVIRHSGSTSNLINHIRIHEMKKEWSDSDDEITEPTPQKVRNVLDGRADTVITINVDSACRICLSDVQSTIHVRVEDNVKTLNNVAYRDIFKEFTGFDVFEHEPQYFCFECSKKLEVMNQLRQQCIETQNFLDEWLQADEMTQEETKIKENLQEVDFLIEEVEEDHSFETATPMKYEKNLEITEATSYSNFYHCEYCSSFFKTKRGMKDHYRAMHLDKKTFECVHCKTKLFSSFFNDHLQQCKKANIPSVCPICGIIFDPKYIQRHIEAHKLSQSVDENIVIKPYKCDICGVRTMAKCGMVKHMQVQHLQHRLRCEVCFAEFKTPSVLSSHLRKYHPEKKSPLKCKLCDFTTADASVLRRHHLYHTGEKRHKCEVCGREFRAKDVLRDHMTTHSDERPFQCSSCQSTFKTRKALGVHMKTHRAHEYECPVCQKTYLTNQQMRNHVKKSHPEYELPPPGTIFNKNWRIRKAREEMKESALKEGFDTSEVESLVILEPPPIEEKMYFRTNYTDVDRYEEI